MAVRRCIIPGRIRHENLERRSEVVQVGPVEVTQERGKNIKIYGRTLTPVALVVRAGRRRGMVGTQGIGGSAWGAAMVVPRMVIEERDGKQRKLPVRDETALVLCQMAAVALAAPVLSAFLVWLHRQMCREERKEE